MGACICSFSNVCDFISRIFFKVLRSWEVLFLKKLNSYAECTCSHWLYSKNRLIKMKELVSFYKLSQVWNSDSKECVDRKRFSPPWSVECFAVYKPVYSCLTFVWDFLKILLHPLASTWKFVLVTWIRLLGKFSCAQLPMCWGAWGERLLDKQWDGGGYNTFV